VSISKLFEMLLLLFLWAVFIYPVMLLLYNNHFCLILKSNSLVLSY